MITLSLPTSKSSTCWVLRIFEIRSNIDDPETARRISSARGDWILQDSDWNDTCRELLAYVVDVEYDQSILLWHIATEFCYNLDKAADPTKSNDKMEYCKTLSDYMVYLLVMQPTMMSSVAGIGQIRFRDTCEEAKRFFSRREIKRGEEQKEACERILEVNTEVLPVDVKGDRRHCRANNHAQLLSKGGELVTFVWLVMAHFGIGEQFQINEGHARAKLIVGK
ncbi:hypothetical protein M0R45_013073 [Rubus argutus]|uniref:DUF4220 domain-containing protein n=1 Tax=Rubus argutus TaxID=59490 RepID=A0AAW1XHN1_RUBAR